jgi:hypothetical protein
MSTSEPADEIEIVASVTQSPSQTLFEPAIENPAEQKSPIPDLDTSDSTTLERNSLSSSETSGMYCDYYYASPEFDVVPSEFFVSQEARTDGFKL